MWCNNTTGVLLLILSGMNNEYQFWKSTVSASLEQNKFQKFYSKRIGHAYLLSGANGCGKMAFALALAEAINGIDHLSELGEFKSSKYSSWFTHPDIHVYIPKPTSIDVSELRSRLELLSVDPYEVINFNQRPSLDKESSSKTFNHFIRSIILEMK